MGEDLTSAPAAASLARSRFRRWLALALSPAFAGIWLAALVICFPSDQVSDRAEEARFQLGYDPFLAYVTAPLFAIGVPLGLRLFRWRATAPKIIVLYVLGPGLVGAILDLIYIREPSALLFPLLAAAVLWPTPLAYCLIARVPWRTKSAD